MLGLLDRGGTGREGEHHFPPAAASGFGDQLDLTLTMGILPGDVVALDEVNTPFSI